MRIDGEKRTYGGNVSPESTSSSEFLRDGGDVVSRQAKDFLISGTIFEKALERVPFCVAGAESHKVRLFCSQKQHFYKNYRTLDDFVLMEKFSMRDLKAKLSSAIFFILADKETLFNISALPL